MEIARDEVRVMTVHGAKGLEAPVVFMIDTTSAPADNARLNLIELARGNAAPGAARRGGLGRPQERRSARGGGGARGDAARHRG
ncbi:MAG: ATP-binding domain-containing protein [Rhodopseudomonas palustris]|nr:ATP-binding domain-containing protein [Rhodopseudomonas palustris]